MTDKPPPIPVDPRFKGLRRKSWRSHSASRSHRKSPWTKSPMPNISIIPKIRSRFRLCCCLSKATWPGTPRAFWKWLGTTGCRRWTRTTRCRPCTSTACAKRRTEWEMPVFQLVVASQRNHCAVDRRCPDRRFSESLGRHRRVRVRLDPQQGPPAVSAGAPPGEEGEGLMSGDGRALLAAGIFCALAGACLVGVKADGTVGLAEKIGMSAGPYIAGGLVGWTAPLARSRAIDGSVP